MSEIKETKWIEFVGDGKQHRDTFNKLQVRNYKNEFEDASYGRPKLVKGNTYRYPAPEETATESVPNEIGGTHYQEGVKVSPWSLEKVMETSGSAFVDARRADVIEYAFRKKGEPSDMIQDLRKAAHCATVAADFMEAEANKEDK